MQLTPAHQGLQGSHVRQRWHTENAHQYGIPHRGRRREWQGTSCERMGSESSLSTTLPAPSVDGPPTNSIARAAQEPCGSAPPIRQAATCNPQAHLIKRAHAQATCMLSQSVKTHYCQPASLPPPVLAG